MGGPVKLGIKWGLVHMMVYREAIKQGYSITFPEALGDYVEKINKNNFIL